LLIFIGCSAAPDPVINQKGDKTETKIEESKEVVEDFDITPHKPK